MSKLIEVEGVYGAKDRMFRRVERIRRHPHLFGLFPQAGYIPVLIEGTQPACVHASRIHKRKVPDV